MLSFLKRLRRPEQLHRRRLLLELLDSRKLLAVDALQLDLDTGSDSGASDTDNLTQVQAPSFTASGVQVGATVELLADGAVLATALADAAIVEFADVDLSGLDDGAIDFQLRHTLDSDECQLDAPLVVTLDRESPTASSLNTPVSAFATRELVVDLAHTEEGSGLEYNLVNAPPALTLDSATGRIEWTPTIEDIGTRIVTLRYTDVAGNSHEEDLSIEVVDAPAAIFDYVFADLDGQRINNAFEGQDFLMEIHVSDNRTSTNRHVFAAYFDLMFDSAFLQAAATDPITFGPNFRFAQSGTTSTGMIDELGAASGSFGERSQLLATIRMSALAIGDVTLSGNAAEGVGHEFLMVDSSGPVPNESIDFGRAELSILKAPQPIQLAFNSSLVADANDSTISNVTVTPEKAGLVDIWADFNGNGDFEDPGEQIVSDFEVTAAETLIPLTIPAGVAAGDVTIAYGLTDDGVLVLVDADRTSATILENATPAPWQIATSGLAIEMTASPSDELMVQQDGVIVFRARGAASISIAHGSGDSRLSIHDLSSILPSDDALSIDGGAGGDVVVLRGLDADIDLSDAAHPFRGLEAIEIMDASRIAIDETGFALLAPAGDELALAIESLTSLVLVDDWQLDSAEVTAAGLVRKLVSGSATVQLSGGPVWTNPINPLDVNAKDGLGPIDVLIILNELTLRRYIEDATNALKDPATLDSFPGLYYDTNGNGSLTPVDALRVINALTIASLEPEHMPIDIFGWENEEEDEDEHPILDDQSLGFLF